MGNTLARNVVVRHDGGVVALKKGTDPGPELGALVTGGHNWEGGVCPYADAGDYEPQTLAEALAQQTVPHLREYAAKNAIPLGEATRKADIVAAILAAESVAASLTPDGGSAAQPGGQADNGGENAGARGDGQGDTAGGTPAAGGDQGGSSSDAGGDGQGGQS